MQTEIVPFKARQSAEMKSVLALIRDASKDPAVDPSKMTALFELRQRAEKAEAERAFNIAMTACQGELPSVFRGKTGDKSIKYADLEAIDNATRPTINAHGFSESYGSDASPMEGHYGVTCIVGHVGGHTRLYRCDVPISTKGPQGKDLMTPIHAFGSAMTYGRRYLKCLIWNIVLTNDPVMRDDDGRAAGQEFVQLASTGQVAEMRRELASRDLPEQFVLDYVSAKGFPIASLDELEAATVKPLLRLIQLRPLAGGQ